MYTKKIMAAIGLTLLLAFTACGGNSAFDPADPPAGNPTNPPAGNPTNDPPTGNLPDTGPVIFSVTVNNMGAGGSVGASPVSGAAGTVITLSNTPAADYTLDYYIVDGSKITGSTFTLTKDVTVSGIFIYTGSGPTSTVTVTQPSNGVINANPLTAPNGTVITLSNTPAAYYILDYYTVDGAKITGNTFTLTKDVTVSGVFSIPTYTVSVIQPSNGSINANHSTALNGTVITLSNTPAAYYTLDYYTVDGAKITGNTFTLTKNVTVSGVFTIPTYTVTVTQPSNGSIINANHLTAPNGTVITLSNTPAAGYILDYYTVDGAKITGSTFTLTKDVTVSGVFTISTFTSIAAFKTWLDAQPANTAATAYNVKLNVNDLGGSSSTAGSAGYALSANPTKYVNLDLSGSTITGIGYRAFMNCTRLIGVTIPNSVTGIGDMAFYGTSLFTVTIPNNVKSIGDFAFYGTIITGVTIPSSVTSIGDSAFYNCVNLTGVTIGSGVTSIGNQAFVGCRNLTAINVDAANTAYSSVDGVLYDKAKTTLVAYPAGKTGSTFTIPSSVTSIGSHAFVNCTSLASVTIPDSVKSIGNWAFSHSGLTSVTIGSGVTTIGDNAFYYCTNLTGELTIPNSVTTIGTAAFAGCQSLAYVIIGNGVTSIGNLAFFYNNRLIFVTFQGTIPSSGFNSDAFNDLGDLRDKFYSTNPTNGTPGTYTRASGGSTWSKTS